jgi:hypothetical protein
MKGRGRERKGKEGGRKSREEETKQCCGFKDISGLVYK